MGLRASGSGDRSGLHAIPECLGRGAVCNVAGQMKHAEKN